ncbi:histidine phosphatase family protein [Fusobacterium sp. PH5-44]|uniref:histidine phosphatase family protein n=1 Tax=unclassified Fusobacterium TaxID=2648384 RepID=UPI003D1E4A5D
MKLYLVRHGETVWNVEKRFQGKSDSPLTQKGILQAKLLSDYLKNENFNAFYSSPAKRAMDTANMIIGNRNQNLNIINDFAEISIGDMEGVESHIFKEKYPELFYNFFFDPEKYNPKLINGESFKELENRVKIGLNNLTHKHKEHEKILLVSHGGTLRTLFNLISPKKDKELCIIANTSVSIVEYKEKSYELMSFSDTSHLEGMRNE